MKTLGSKRRKGRRFESCHPDQYQQSTHWNFNVSMGFLLSAILLNSIRFCPILPLSFRQKL
nr:MAG TPA: hypothetical protein [Caudoviricetes sp.]